MEELINRYWFKYNSTCDIWFHETGLNEILNIKTPARLSQYLTSDTEMNDDGIAVLKEALLSFKKLPTNLMFKSFILLRQCDSSI